MRASEHALNNQVKIAFGQGNLRWKPGHLRSAYGATCLPEPELQSCGPEGEILGEVIGPSKQR
jgi:hypothetical protein